MGGPKLKRILHATNDSSSTNTFSGYDFKVQKSTAFGQCIRPGRRVEELCQWRLQLESDPPQCLGVCTCRSADLNDSSRSPTSVQYWVGTSHMHTCSVCKSRQLGAVHRFAISSVGASAGQATVPAEDCVCLMSSLSTKPIIPVLPNSPTRSDTRHGPVDARKLCIQTTRVTHAASLKRSQREQGCTVAAHTRTVT